MTELNKIILSKLLDGESVNEIAKSLNKTPIQVHKQIKCILNSGYTFTSEIKDDGNVIYRPEYSLRIPKTNTAYLKLENGHFKAMLISDLHLGNVNQNIRYLNEIYEYCVKEGIHIIINAGDVIDGTFSKSKQKISTPEEQIAYAIKNYPFDKNIISLICYGNHDYSALENFGINVNQMINNARPDLIGLGFGISIVNLESDQFFIKHPVNNIGLKTIDKKLIICGHKHKAALFNQKDTFIVNVPPLSDLCFDNKQKYPGAYKMELVLNKGVIKAGYFEQLIFNKGLKTVCESEFTFDFNRELLTESDIFNKPKVKSLQNRQMTQIDKFNERYHR